MIKLKLLHTLNHGIKNHSEQVFKGISNGRKKTLEYLMTK